MKIMETGFVQHLSISLNPLVAQFRGASKI